MNVAILDQQNVVTNIIICTDDYVLGENEIKYTEANSAHIDGIYHEGYFYPEQPFPSWTRSGTGFWNPPISKPETNRETNPNNLQYFWNEENLEWTFG